MKRITKKTLVRPKNRWLWANSKSGEGWLVTIVWLVFMGSALFYLHSINLLNIINITIVIVIAAIILLIVAALTY